MLQRDLERRLSVERQATGQRLKEDHTDRVEIGRRAEHAAARLFRGHVVRRADGGAGGGILSCPERAGHAEVSQFDLTIAGANQEVLRLHVAVDDPALVRRPQSPQQAVGQSDDAFGGEPAFAPDDRFEVGALDQLHGDEVGIAVRAVIVDVDDIRV
jgi:hypothetical protein